jgi:hypothetical protein
VKLLPHSLGASILGNHTNGHKKSREKYLASSLAHGTAYEQNILTKLCDSISY